MEQIEAEFFSAAMLHVNFSNISMLVRHSYTLSGAPAGQYEISLTGGFIIAHHEKTNRQSSVRRLILFSSNLLPRLKPIMPISKHSKEELMHKGWLNWLVFHLILERHN